MVEIEDESPKAFIVAVRRGVMIHLRLPPDVYLHLFLAYSMPIPTCTYVWRTLAAYAALCDARY